LIIVSLMPLLMITRRVPVTVSEISRLSSRRFSKYGRSYRRTARAIRRHTVPPAKTRQPRHLKAHRFALTKHYFVVAGATATARRLAIRSIPGANAISIPRHYYRFDRQC
jgi:hypothetical protein